MSGIGLGTSNRGLFDLEDNLSMKKNPVKSGVTAQEAESFARSNSGAEVIIKDDKGTYSIYQMETSQSGKTITNQDFTNDSIKLTQDATKKVGGKKAYVMTTDNVIRSLEIKGIELPNIEQKFGSADISLELKDKDGIETKSKNDLEGIISGNLSVSKESIQYSLAQASKSTGLDFKLKVDPTKNEYVITVSKGVDLGSVTLKMDKGGMNAQFNLSGLVNGLGYAINPIAMYTTDPEAIITGVIRNKLSKDIGMSAVTVSRNEIRMTPDFKNNKMISQIPVGDMSVNLESVKSNDMSFKINPRGDLNIDLGRTVVTASSDGKGQQTKGLDTEGTDTFKTRVKANLGNDLDADIKSNSSVEVKITDPEKAVLASRMQKLSGMGVSIGGNAHISDIQVDGKITNGKFNLTNQQSGKLSAEKLSIGMGSSTLKIDSASGELDVKEESKKIIVDAKNVDIKGGVESPETSINFKKLSLNGQIVFDKADPSKIKLQGDKTKGITLSVDMKDKKSGVGVTVEEFNIKGTDIDIDMTKRNISLKPQDPNAIITINKIKMGNIVDLNKVSFRGNLDVNAFTGKVALESRALSFNGKLGDIQVDNLSASGKMTFDPATGLKIQGLDLKNARGKVGEFDISRIKAKADMSFDTAGNLSLGSVSSLQLDSASGVKASGNAKVKFSGGVFDFTVSPAKPFNITYKPDKTEKPLVSGQFEGNLKYDTNNSTFSFNNGEKPFKVKQGSIAGTEFKNFSLNGEVNIGTQGIVTLNNTKGETVISGTVAGINLKELKSDSPITVDSNNKSVNMNGNVSIELPDQKLKLATTGNITLTNKPDGKIILDSKDGMVTGKIGNIELENFKVSGKVTFDPKTGNIDFEDQNGTGIKTSGKISGKTFNLESSGTISFNKDATGNTKISSQGIDFKGNIEGFNITSNGTKGDVTLSPSGSLVSVQGLESDISIEGINLKSKGGLNSTDSGYQIKLDGSLTQDSGKMASFLQKLTENPMVPESSKASILAIQEKLSKINVQNIKYENLTIDLDKNFSFNNMSVTAKELDIKYPEKAMTLSSKGDVTFEMNKEGKMSINSKNGVINANIAGTEYKDFKINGKMEYEPTSGSIAFSGLLKQDVTISGKIANKQVDLSSNASIKLEKKGDDIEFSGNEMNLRGNLDGFKIQSLSPATGKIILKNDGHTDLSQLKFTFKVDDVIMSNKQGSLKGSNDGYTIKLGGDVRASHQSLLKLLDKISVNSTTPEAAKHTLKETLKNINQFQITGNMKSASYNDFVINLDRGLNLQNISVDAKLKMDNTSINLNLGKEKTQKLNLGAIDVTADIKGGGSDFSIKNGSISFALTPDVKASMSKEVENILAVYDLKNMDIAINDDGTIKVKSATYKGLPIVNVDLGVTAKFEGTNFNIVLDKANIKGFFGRVAQKIYEGVTGDDSRVMGVREAVKQMTDLKVNYKDGDRKFSIDFKDVIHDKIGKDFELKNIGFNNGRFSMDYEVNVTK